MPGPIFMGRKKKKKKEPEAENWKVKTGLGKEGAKFELAKGAFSIGAKLNEEVLEGKFNLPELRYEIAGREIIKHIDLPLDLFSKLEKKLGSAMTIDKSNFKSMKAYLSTVFTGKMMNDLEYLVENKFEINFHRERAPKK